MHGRNALITGSTSGIGLAMARAFAARGSGVMLNGLGDKDEIEGIRAGLQDEFNVTIVYSPADMTRPDDIRAMVDDGVKALGSVDILINNAGIQHVAPVEDFAIDKWDAVIAINLSAAFHAIAAALPGMKARNWGRIINTASAHALVASPFKSAYVAAKHGIAGLTKTVALEVAEHAITVNAIALGYVWTPLVERQIPDTMQALGLTAEQVKRDVLLAAQPTKQFVTVEQVAAFACFLASDEAASITGATLPIDGGWTAH